jgi:hypothetical protein
MSKKHPTFVQITFWQVSQQKVVVVVVVVEVDVEVVVGGEK